MNAFTPIQDIDQKIDIIDHVNQDHSEEILAIARTHQPQQAQSIRSAKILDIYQQGIKISVLYKTDIPNIETIVPFEIEGELEERILYLAYAAIVKQGREFSGTGKRFFEITHKQSLTTNMLRLTIKSNTALAEYYPGYAYAFYLKTIKKPPESTPTASQARHWSKHLFDRCFLWLMKHLSKKNRQKLLQKANQGIRLYTLRKSWKSNPNDSFANRGYIDIFTHGNTQGSQWAQSLEIGNVIMSRSETPDKHPHLHNGRALLIADETAYPALAGIVEQWQNPIAPQVILVSSHQNEQAYFTAEQFPQGSDIHTVVCPATEQGNQVLTILTQLDHIEVVWAALESESAKQIRHYLRNERKVMGKNNHTKAYWSLKSKRA